MGNILIENGKAIGALSSPATADSVIYDNTQSEMTATNVQDAIDEINTNMDNCGNLVELEYGVSTYAEFLEAYKKHKIVYCKASSKTNPAFGSKVRKAFMAYVNNDTTPTEVEFQYYRSLTTYSEANQHDEIHIYKLSSSNGWSYTKRVAGQNIEATDGVKATFASNAVTFSLDKSIVANNLTTTAEGSVLDARQGKVLNDKIDELNADIDKSYKEVWSGSDTTFPATTTNFINGNLTGYTYAGVLVDNVLHIIKMGVRTRITDTFYLNGAVYVATRVFTINETNFVTEAGETNGTVTANRIVPKAIVGIH